MAPEPPIGFDNPQVRFIEYANGTYGNGTVVGCSIQPDTPPKDMPPLISFGSGVDQATQDAVINVAENTPEVFGGWQPIAIPDVAGFTHDVITDPMLSQYPLALQMAFGISAPDLTFSDRKNFTGKATAWVNEAYPQQGPALISLINTYAVNRWVPISGQASPAAATPVKPPVKPPPPPPPKPQPKQDFLTWFDARLNKGKPSTVITIDYMIKTLADWKIYNK